MSGASLAGAADSLARRWASGSGTPSALSITVGANNAVYGFDQSEMLANNYADTEDAKFCRSLNYGGYTDWYLPAKDELAFLYTNRAAVPGFSYSGFYSSSTEAHQSSPWFMDPSNGSFSNYANNKPSSFLVRCVRRY